MTDNLLHDLWMFIEHRETKRLQLVRLEYEKEFVLPHPAIGYICWPKPEWQFKEWASKA